MSIDAVIDEAPIRKFRRNYGFTYYVAARLGDPLFQPARARAIWAAHTASAASRIGLRPLLVVGRSNLPFRLESQGAETNADRILADFYGIDGHVDLLVLNEIDRTQNELESAQNAALREFDRNVLHQSFCHIRDPVLARWCSERGPAFLYEDHGEDYHDAARPRLAETLNSPACRLVVAITQEIADRLVAEGVDAAKIEVHPSASSIGRGMFDDDQIERCRAFHLRDGSDKLVVYAGGLQQERGIAHILEAAEQFPNYQFVIVGGHSVDIEAWQKSGRSPTNVCWAGYMALPDTTMLEMAADLLLATRENSDRMKISSPLKFFEYLRTGTPIVSYAIPEEVDVTCPSLAIERYDPAQPATIVSAIAEVIKRFPRMKGGYEQNIAAGENHSWEGRLHRIIKSLNSRKLRG